MRNATPDLRPAPTQPPFAVWNPTRGVWETSQLDLYGQLEPYSQTWPTSGMTRAGSAYRPRPSAHPTSASGSSSSPTVLLRTPVVSDSRRGSETLQQVKARRGTIWLTHQLVDLALNGPPGSPNKQREPATLWTLIDTIFNDGGTTPAPSPDGNTSPADQHPPRHS